MLLRFEVVEHPVVVQVLTAKLDAGEVLTADAVACLLPSTLLLPSCLVSPGMISSSLRFSSIVLAVELLRQALQVVAAAVVMALGVEVELVEQLLVASADDVGVASIAIAVANPQQQLLLLLAQPSSTLHVSPVPSLDVLSSHTPIVSSVGHSSKDDQTASSAYFAAAAASVVAAAGVVAATVACELFASVRRL